MKISVKSGPIGANRQQRPASAATSKAQAAWRTCKTLKGM